MPDTTASGPKNLPRFNNKMIFITLKFTVWQCCFYTRIPVLVRETSTLLLFPHRKDMTSRIWITCKSPEIKCPGSVQQEINNYCHPADGYCIVESKFGEDTIDDAISFEQAYNEMACKDKVT